ncbi:hypothetical protein [Pseudaeromonas paramecii]|uniref:Uncharacterized protein n=1 Tax=Pseudaeromonas paramecii TaxID=2138166 RepID=A0ABP8PWD2_9GAMM
MADIGDIRSVMARQVQQTHPHSQSLSLKCDVIMALLNLPHGVIQ